MNEIFFGQESESGKWASISCAYVDYLRHMYVHSQAGFG